MIKNFTRKQLQEQLGFDLEETKIILDYQKKLPVLVENDGIDGFCMDARCLHNQLGVSKNYSTWIKSNVNNYIEGKDYKTEYYKANSSISPREIEGFNTQKLASLGISKEYFLTINVAKEISMFTGSNSQANDILKEHSRLARQYFILMEKAVKKNIEWLGIRNPEKEGYKKLCSAINEYMIDITGKNALDWDYRFEADALNVICTGFKAQSIKNYLGCIDNITRDSLTSTYNEYLSKMQEMDIVYLGMRMNRYQRYEALLKTFNILFPNAIPLIDNTDISKIIENKEAYLEEVKSKSNDTTLPFGLSA